MHLIWGREKVEKLFILEEIASLVLDVAPLQRYRKLKEELKQWIVAVLMATFTNSLLSMYAKVQEKNVLAIYHHQEKN